jgi:hypothetical protein
MTISATIYGYDKLDKSREEEQDVFINFEYCPFYNLEGDIKRVQIVACELRMPLDINPGDLDADIATAIQHHFGLSAGDVEMCCDIELYKMEIFLRAV